MAFLRTLKKAEVPDGTIREFQLEGKTLAISNVGGKVCAINNVCLHRGGPLAEGELAGDVVTCPWHGWQYNVCSGKLPGFENSSGILGRNIIRSCDLPVNVR